MAEQNFQEVRRFRDIAAPVVSGDGSARFPLSASLSGSPIPVSNAATGDIIHTFPTNTNAMEELYVYAYNFSTSNINLSMSFATGSADAFVVNNVITPVASRTGMTLCYPGIPHKSTKPNYPLNVYVRADSSTALGVMGYVIRYYPVDNSNDISARTFGYNTE